MPKNIYNENNPSSNLEKHESYKKDDNGTYEEDLQGNMQEVSTQNPDDSSKPNYSKRTLNTVKQNFEDKVNKVKNIKDQNNNLNNIQDVLDTDWNNITSEKIDYNNSYTYNQNYIVNNTISREKNKISLYEKPQYSYQIGQKSNITIGNTHQNTYKVHTKANTNIKSTSTINISDNIKNRG